MSSPTSISVQKLDRLVGTPKAPIIVDVRDDDAFRIDPRLLPGSVRIAVDRIEKSGATFADRGAIVVCDDGGALSEGAAALLRQAGVAANTLEGGFTAWAEAGLPLVVARKVPPRDPDGRTVWVTRARPKIDRIASPWLIRRFVDPLAIFLFVPPSEVEGVARRFGATAFDMETGFWTHRGERCTFDVMVEEFGLGTEALLRLATIVRAADTDRLDLAPQAPGLLAVSLGLSRMFADDTEQLEAGMVLYDALYRWARDAAEETHGWPPRAAKAPATAERTRS